MLGVAALLGACDVTQGGGRHLGFYLKWRKLAIF